MADEEKKVDQAPDAGTQKVEQPAKVEPSAEKKGELPKEDFFTGSAMDTWMKDQGLSDEPAPPEKKTEPQKKEEVKAKEDPCPECPDKDGKRPIKVLTVNGKKVPVYTQEEYDELAQKGAASTETWQKAADHEKDLTGRESKLADLASPLTKLVDAFETGKIPMPQTPEGVTEQKSEIQEILDNEEIDPEIRKVLKLQQDKLDTLTESNKKFETGAKMQNLAQVRDEMATTFASAREEFPFDDIQDEGGENLAVDIYSGLVTSLYSKDKLRNKQDPTYKIRSMGDIMRDAAKTIHKLQTTYKQAATADSVDGGVPVTAELIAEKHPEIYESIGKAAITAHLKGQETIPTIPKASEKGETRVGESKVEPKGLDDAFDLALKDEEVVAGLDEIGKKAKLGGLTT